MYKTGCTDCGGDHKSGGCPKRPRDPPEETGGNRRCPSCRKIGFHTETCEMATCHECGRTGHWAPSCPRRLEKCVFCLQKGHLVETCEIRRMYPGEQRVCYLCLKPGHAANECHNEVACRVCKSSGHVAQSCPQVVCKRCGSKGHTQRGCPQIRCFRCGNAGHMSDSCRHDVDSPSSTLPPPKKSDSPHSSRSITPSPPRDAPPPPPQPKTSSAPSPAKPRSMPASLDCWTRPLTNGRVAVVIDGGYFERCLGHTCRDGDYGRVATALRHVLNFLGDIFRMQPFGFWFDTDPKQYVTFVERHMPSSLREHQLRNATQKKRLLTDHMNAGKDLPNVVARLVGRYKRQGGYGGVGGGGHAGGIWTQSGVDVALATSIIECFIDPRFDQVVMLTGDGDLLPSFVYCNSHRMRDGKVHSPLRICGISTSIAVSYGDRQDLADFLPPILLDSHEHIEGGERTPLPIAPFFVDMSEADMAAPK